MKKVYFFSLLVIISQVVEAQTTVTITADKDNTIFNNSNSLSNGAGADLFAGVTGNFNPGNGVRRALVHFNLSSIPVGSTITSATLTLNIDKQAGPGDIALHKLTKDWGEGTSDATSGEGKGAAATAGDATWDKTFSPSTFWTNPGGDFVATATASQSNTGVGVVTFSGANMIADVQSFVANPASNFGWIIKGANESTVGNAQRFVSRNSSSIAQRPSLTVTYTTTLPITLKSFSATANKQNALLKWSTATELNNDHFAVEHSVNGKDFTSIGVVKANGTSNSDQTYTFLHEKIGNGKHFYRIVDIDKNGNKKHSQIITLSLASTASLQVFPNPATSFISVTTSSVLAGSEFSISSLAGQLLIKGKITEQQINIQKLSAGQYWLTVKTNAGELLKAQFLKK